MHFNEAHHDVSSLTVCAAEPATLPPKVVDPDKSVKQHGTY